MKLGDLLKEEHILTGFQAGDKRKAIGTLVDLLETHGRIPKDRRASVYDALVARENIASTGMEHGVAIPHASVEALNEACAALAISPEGVPFLSADGHPAKLIFLLVIPRQSVQQHIRTLAGIARLMNYEEVRDALVRAKSAREAMAIIRSEEE